MEPQLPPVQIFTQACAHENAWSDHYGALHTAADYAGLQLPEQYFIRGIWQHGCFGPWQDQSPSVLCYNAPNSLQRPVRVARQDQADLLRTAGYQNVRVIGLPIVYTPDPKVERLPGSLLVVPTHTLIGDSFTDRSAFERYAEEIAQHASRFSRVTVCIHPSCRQNGLWVKEFTNLGYEVVYGASTNDRNALQRMRWLFERYETVTTNGWGSHVAYALAFGAKVSIYGTQPRRSESDYLRDLTWAADPAALKREISGENARRERETLAALYLPPAEAKLDVAFGRAMIGADHRLSPAEMAAELANLVDTPITPSMPGWVPPIASAGGATVPRLLFISHEATRTGAPMFLLHFLRWLRRETALQFEVLLAKGGPLEEEFAKVAVVHHANEFIRKPDGLAGFSLIYANTICCVDLLEALTLGSTPVITHVHELDFGYEWLGPRRIAACVRHTSHFVACSQVVAKRLTELFGIPAQEISIHYEMIDASRLIAGAASDTAALRAQYDLPKNAVILTGCGTVDFRKGVDLFIQVVRQVKARLGPGRVVRGVWVGAGTIPDLWRLLRHDIRKMGLEKEIKLVGEMADPHALLNLGDVYCLTSREDPFPLAMLEAGAKGMPVVCFAGAGGADEFCALGGGRAVPYLNTEAMAEACCEIAGDREKRAQLGGQAATLVRSRFVVDAIAPGLWRELQTRLPRLPDSATTVARRSRALAEIFHQWPDSETKNHGYVQATLHRFRSRQQARDMVRSGSRREAVQLLVKSVTASLSTKDAGIICESLLEIGDDMATLDAKQAELLHSNAAVVARNAGLDLAVFRRGQRAGQKPA